MLDFVVKSSTFYWSEWRDSNSRPLFPRLAAELIARSTKKAGAKLIAPALAFSIGKELENRTYSRTVQRTAIRLYAQIQAKVLASVINTKMVKMDRQVPSVMISPASS